MSSTRKIHPDDIQFSLAIKVRSNGRGNLLGDITVNEIYSYGDCYDDESMDRSRDGTANDTITDCNVLTDEELNTVIIHNENFIVFGYDDGDAGGFRKKYLFSSDKVTIKEFVDAIIDFEKVTRPLGFYGIDRTNIFYEGLGQVEQNGPYFINWGS